MGWVFFRHGAAFANVIATLSELADGLISLRGRLGSDTGSNVTNYLIWAEGAEPKLRAIFVDVGIPAGLWTERAWRIRELTDHSHRPVPLIAAEIDFQLERVDEIRQQVTHYRDLVTPSSGQSLLMLDTNVYVHGRQFDEIAWDKVLGAKAVRILVPLIVVDELDKVKNGGRDSAHHAGTVLRAFDRLLPAGKGLQAHQLRQNVELQILDEPSDHTRLPIADDEIVRQAHYFSLLAERPVVVGTRDRGMRIRAEAAQLDVQVLRGSELDRTHAAKGEND